MMRNIEDVLKDLKLLVRERGYIYSFCMILVEDFHMNPETLHEIDYEERVSTKEATMILGFLVQNELNWDKPESPNKLMDHKKRTYELMHELHQSFMKPFRESYKNNLKRIDDGKDITQDFEDPFSKGEMLKEPIFYAGDGVYDFQYLEFLEKKYERDSGWLKEKRSIDLKNLQKIPFKIKEILQNKAKKVNHYFLKDKVEEIKSIVKDQSEEEVKMFNENIFPAFELHQYVNLFLEGINDENNNNLDQLYEKGWESFFKEIIDLFTIKESDFHQDLNIAVFFDNFSLEPKKGVNREYNTIGDFNLFNAKPIIKIDEERYFVPISFSVFEAVYESPFYWMWLEDSKYRDTLAYNRGQFGEDVTFNILAKIFGKDKTYRSVKIQRKKGEDETDIDILCLLGNKALCVQVKSKKLTLLSRKGDDKKLREDFEGAVQDAYNQGLVCRKKILEKGSKFLHDGKKLAFSEEINEVYILGVTAENYPALLHQSQVFLKKIEGAPYGLFLTIFDLDLLSHYLNDPYDFLYYVKKRIELMDYYLGNEEITLLGYHLERKLWKNPKASKEYVDTSFAKLIDRNYYPDKAGLDISDEGDVIKSRWKNEGFNRLLKEVKDFQEPKITDIIFQLLDFSNETIDALVNVIFEVKSKTSITGNIKDFSMPPNEGDKSMAGISYISFNSNDLNILYQDLLHFCKLRKYKSKANTWIGLGSLLDSKRLVDCIVFNDDIWILNEELEEIVSRQFGGGTVRRVGRKIGRNEKCPCGSLLKYKKCCGK